MKKRFIAALSVLALALALPVAAIAAPSPANTTVTGTNGVTASVNNANVHVASTTKNASNTPTGANVVASFEITEDQAGLVSESNPLTVTFTPSTGLDCRAAKVWMRKVPVGMAKTPLLKTECDSVQLILPVGNA